MALDPSMPVTVEPGAFQKLIGYVITELRHQNAYGAVKISGFLSCVASRANRCHVVIMHLLKNLII